MAHEPMAIAHLGSGICSHSVSTRGAIFTVMVPAITITSACRGVPRTMVPMRSRSTRLAAAAISSMPQQLVAIGKTQRLLRSPHCNSKSMGATPTESPGTESMFS